MNWSWLPDYAWPLWHGLGVTFLVLAISVVGGFLFAVPLALAQISGQGASARLAQGFCSLMRGTPLLLQLYMLYYGLGSLFPMLPREWFGWLARLDAIYYVLLAFTLNFAGYEAEVLRGALLAVPKGQLEAAHSLGLNERQVLRYVWLPLATYRILPTLAGDIIAQLKSTPVAFTVPVMDFMGVARRVTQDTALYYEPLLLVAATYLVLAFAITQVFARFEKKVRQFQPN